MSLTDELPWNTTRCNRLLRPLSSKLAKLHKEFDRPRSANGERRAATANAFSIKASPRKAALVSQSALPRKPRAFEKRKDPDWMPVAGPHGANRKTYGARGAKKANNAQRVGLSGSSTRPGELPFTPLISRVGGSFQASSPVDASPARKVSKNKGPLNAETQQIQELKERLPVNIGNLVNGLSEAYANLLKATSVEGEKRRNGTRSLFSSCLRKIPDYIELEEHFAVLDREEQDDDDENRDISQETYTYLEAQFESVPGQGWRAFKQVVRAHGTSLVCDAFADQILGLETLQVLVTHCLNSSAWDEAEQLLLSYLPNLRSISMPNTLSASLFDGERSLYMWLCKSFVGRTGRHRFLYSLLAYLISQELLPLEWLATECMRPVWDRLVRILTDGDSRSIESALLLLETAISAGLGLPDANLDEDVPRQVKPSARHEFRKALDTTFSSLLTIFCSIALVNQNRDEGSGDHIARRVTWVLDSVVVGLLTRTHIPRDLKLLNSAADYTQAFAERAAWVVFSSFLIHIEGRQTDSSLILLDAHTIAKAICWIVSQYASISLDISTLLTTLSEFASSAARATGKIWKDDGFDQIQRFVQCMLSLSGIRLPHKLWTFKRLALESAMEFAHNTSDSQHMAYALKIENTMRTKGHVVINPSPHKDDSPSANGGFRWEEGIGEWVACTPFAKQDVKPVPRKPMRPLSLLPTPNWSQDKNSDLEELSTAAGNDQHSAEMDEDEDEDYTFPQSSPVQQRRQVSASSLGKRSRASSPMVFIPAKRQLLTPPKSPVVFYPELPEYASDDGARRSRRLKDDANAREPNKFANLPVRRRPRSRSALNKGLRNQQRMTYEEEQDLSPDDEEEESSPEADVDRPVFSASIGAYTLRTRNSFRGRKSEPDEGEGEGEGENKENEPIRRRRPRSSRNNNCDANRRRSGRRSKVPGEWWRVDASDAAAGGDDDESEDELSCFL
jgi:hypothetical protein